MPKPKPTELADVVDLLSYAGSGVLADHINAYWAERGRAAGAERYEMPGGGGYGVRSAMVNGIAPTLESVVRSARTLR